MTDSSMYEPTKGHVTIDSAERVFSHVNEVERNRLANKNKSPLATQIDEMAEE